MNATINLKPLPRVFVGIKVTGQIAEACAKLQTKFAGLPTRLIVPQDIHLTLLPPWQMTDQYLTENLLRQALHSAKNFVLKLKKLTYGPNKARPRLAWIECDAPEGLIKLKKSLLETFKMTERAPFFPHITIARFSNKDRNLIKHLPLKQPLALSMPVESVELFASIHQDGIGYRVLASILFPFDNSTSC